MLKIHRLAESPMVVAITFLLVALILGKLILSFGLAFPLAGDAPDYLIVAKNILAGTYPPHENVIYPPGYPAGLAVTLALGGGSINFIYLVQFMFLAGIAWLTYFISLRYFTVTPLLALTAGTIVLLWPYFILYSLLIYAEVIYSFLLLSSLALTLESWRRHDRRFAAGAGVFLALATLTKPVALLLPFWVAGLVVLWFMYQKTTPVWWRFIAVGIGVFILTLIPWMTYVYNQTGVPAPVSTHFDSVFNRTMNLSYEPWRGYSNADPATTAELIQSKLLNVFRFWNPGAGGTQAELLIERVPKAVYAIWLYKIGFFIVLALAAISLFFPHRYRWLLWVVILYFWSVHTVLYPYPRYTLPIIPFVIILAAFSTHQLYTRHYATNTKHLSV